MKSLIVFFVAALTAAVGLQAQTLQCSPEKPIAGETVTLSYDQTKTILVNEKELKATALLLNNNPTGDRFQIEDVEFTAEKGVFKAKLSIPANVNVFYIAFANEVDGAKDNNRVLVAEDIQLNQLLVKIILKDFGFDVDIAENGKIAIEKLQENKYDIILMDLLMPELNGFEATEHIRSKMNSQIPIIALTADVTTVDVEKCKAVGMNDYLSKPVDEKLLYSKIIKYIKKTNWAAWQLLSIECMTNSRW